MDVVEGMRVVRGPNWKWGEQDGGEGGVGTVVEVHTQGVSQDGTTLERGVVVQWDTGNRCNYRSAITGCYDLRLLDNGPVGCKHPAVKCDSCQEGAITGIRWKCVSCYDFDLCTQCYNAGKHSLEHEFLRVVVPQGPRVKVSPRFTAHSVMSKGIFPNAEVARGHDWLWGDQDGGLGKTGRLHCIRGWENDNSRSIAEVEWRETGKRNVYRVGHKGKVDLRCVEPANGGHYYPEHLPVLGAPYEPNPNPEPEQELKSQLPLEPAAVPTPKEISVPTPEPTSESVPVPLPVASPPRLHNYSPGDKVRVELDEEIFKMMQEGHGGWDEQLLEFRSEVGTVQAVLSDGDIRVRYSGSKVYTINGDAITKVRGDHVTNFTAGDVVRILDDIATVHNLQEGHGGWVDDMALSLGQAGRIVKVFPTGDVRVAVNGRTWTYNPHCMIPAPEENPPEALPEVPEPEGEGLGLQLKLLSLLENPAVIVAAAASGDVATLRDFLRKHPTQVNAKAAGKAAIHCASVAGNVDVINCLLEFSPDLEVEDEDGDKPLHLCAYSDEDEVAQLLVNANADVNSKNNKGATPLIIAAVKGHQSVLRILANHSNIKLHEQDSDGDTALHCAVLAQKNESTNILLDAGADPTLLNFRLFTPIHEAARIGFLSAVDQFIRRYPDSMNIKKDDGYTPLHLASLNDHLDVVTALADLETCDVNARTNDNQTALHLAVHQGHCKIVERLVGYGVELNVQDENGDTPLHFALARESVESLSPDTPQLKKVQESIMQQWKAPRTGTTVACFLVQEGAEIHLQNKNCHTPLQLCSPEIITIVMTFTGSSSSFHGSMKCPPSHMPPVTISMDGLSKGGEKITTVADGMSKDGASCRKVPDGHDVCFLCEAPVDVRFEPCGHALMCHDCAERAKKCPTCKKQVKAISKLKEVCVMCKEEEASVTLQPCGHMYCQACCRRMKVCFECRSVIHNKVGLGKFAPFCCHRFFSQSCLLFETEAAESVPAGVSGSVGAQPCAICLTEPRNTALQCGHLLCWDCAQRVDHCPVCRKFVSHRIRLFE